MRSSLARASGVREKVGRAVGAGSGDGPVDPGGAGSVAGWENGVGAGSGEALASLTRQRCATRERRAPE